MDQGRMGNEGQLEGYIGQEGDRILMADDA